MSQTIDVQFSRLDSSLVNEPKAFTLMHALM